MWEEVNGKDKEEGPGSETVIWKDERVDAEIEKITADM